MALGDALRAAGITDISGYLDAHPAVADRLRHGMVILDVNEAAVRMFGAAGRADMIGQRTQRFFDPLCTAQVNSARAFATGATAFQQQHLFPRGREPVGERAAAGSGADDDHVVVAVVGHGASSGRRRRPGWPPRP